MILGGFILFIIPNAGIALVGLVMMIYGIYLSTTAGKLQKQLNIQNSNAYPQQDQAGHNQRGAQANYGTPNINIDPIGNQANYNAPIVTADPRGTQIHKSNKKNKEQDNESYSHIITKISNSDFITSSSQIMPNFLVYNEPLSSTKAGDNRRFTEVAIVNFENSKYLIMIGTYGSIIFPLSDINAIQQYYEIHSQRYGRAGTYYEGNTQGVTLETNIGKIFLVGRGTSIKKYYQFAELLFTESTTGKYKRNVWTPIPFVFVPFMMLPIINIFWQRSWNKRFHKGIKISIHNFQTLSYKLREKGIQIPTIFLQV